MNSMEQMEARIKEAFADEQYVKELFALEKPEDAQAKLREKGISMTLEEVKAIPQALQMLQANDGELSEDALEDVAGGFAVTASVLGAAVAMFVGGAGVGVAASVARGW